MTADFAFFTAPDNKRCLNFWRSPNS